MKNTLAIYASDHANAVYRNVENFRTLENGVNIFDVGPDTILVSTSMNFEAHNLQAGTVQFKGNFIYYNYTQTAPEKYEKPKSYGGGRW